MTSELKVALVIKNGRLLLLISFIVKNLFSVARFKVARRKLLNYN